MPLQQPDVSLVLSSERRSATDVPVTTTVSVSQTDTPPVTSVPVETEHQEPETLPVRTFLPSGSPPRTYGYSYS